MAEKRLYHNIAEQIDALIQRGIFPPGSRLPGERELAEKFGVSRVTIREAEIALQAIGKLEIKTGSGVYVSEQQPEDHARLPDCSPFELTEARSLFESESAALAARNIDDAVLDELRKLLDDIGSEDHEISQKADRQFHLSIAEASGNSAIVHIIKTLWRMREEIPQVRSTYAAVCETDAAYRTDEHQKIYRALADRDPEAARTAMRDHFHRLIEAMLETTEKQALAEVQKRASESRERFLAPLKS